MSNKSKKIRWILPLSIFIGLNLLMFIFDPSPWTLNFREGKFFDRIMNSKFFTDWFTPFSTPEFNVICVFLAIILLPDTIISFIEYMKNRGQKSNQIE